MKTLQAFWHWVDNEKPAPELYAEKAGDNLSDVAHQALIEAERLVGGRAGAASVELLDRVSDEEHRFLRPAFRDLSLALCAALEHMHDQVEDDYLGKRYPARPDFHTHATLPPCPACHRSPCDGSHGSCKPDRYLRENGLVSNIGIDEMSADAMFVREYLSDWLPKMPPQPISADGPLSGRRLTQQELANMSRDTFRGVDSGLYQARLADMQPSRVLGRPVMNDDGLKLLRHDPNQFYGVMRSHYEEGRLEIFTTVTVAELDRFRGLTPHLIVLRGKPTAYGPNALRYMREVIVPMRLDGAIIETPESAPSDWLGL